MSNAILELCWQLPVVEDPEAFFSRTGVGIAVARVLAARLNSLGRMMSEVRGQLEAERADTARMHEVFRRLEGTVSGGCSSASCLRP